MSKRKITALTAVLLCSLLLVLRHPPSKSRGRVEGLTGVVLANGTSTIDWNVIGGGGGHAKADIYTLDGTTGQAVVGTATDTGLELCSGFWCGAAVAYKIYLPLVLRSD